MSAVPKGWGERVAASQKPKKAKKQDASKPKPKSDNEGPYHAEDT